jgi:hypothetical protein
MKSESSFIGFDFWRHFPEFFGDKSDASSCVSDIVSVDFEFDDFSVSEFTVDFLEGVFDPMGYHFGNKLRNYLHAGFAKQQLYERFHEVNSFPFVSQRHIQQRFVGFHNFRAATASALIATANTAFGHGCKVVFVQNRTNVC